MRSWDVKKFLTLLIKLNVIMDLTHICVFDPKLAK